MSGRRATRSGGAPGTAADDDGLEALFAAAELDAEGEGDAAAQDTGEDQDKKYYAP